MIYIYDIYNLYYLYIIYIVLSYYTPIHDSPHGMIRPGTVADVALRWDPAAKANGIGTGQLGLLQGGKTPETI